MNDLRKQILTGDMDQERVGSMRDILLHECNLELEVATNFDVFKALAQSIADARRSAEI